MKSRSVLPLLLLIGISIRLYYIYGIDSSPEIHAPVLDARWYHDRALAWSAGEGGGEADLFRAPLYPFLIGQVYKVFGSGPHVPRIFHFLIGLGSLFLIYRIGNRVFGRPVGLVAALLALFYYPLVYFEGEILVTTLFTFLLLAGFWQLVRTDQPGASRFLAAGLLIGAAAAARPTALLLVPFLPLWAFRHHRRAVPAILLLAGMLLPPAVVATRNLIVHDEFQIASQGGVNLYIGNHPAADGKTASVPGWRDFSYETKEYEDAVALAAVRIAEGERGRALTPGEVSRYWTGETWKWVRSEPGAAMRLALKKIYFLFNNTEIPNNKLLAPYVREYAPFLYYVTPGAGLLIALGTAGLFLSGGSKRGKELLALVLVLFAASIVAFFVCSRFRVPLMPIWILFAAHLLVRLFRERRSFPFLRAAPVALAVLFLSHTGWFGVREVADLSSMLFSRGYVFAETGRTDEAIEMYRASLAEAPGDPRTMINIGTLLAGQGKMEEAEETLREALRHDSRYAPFVWNNLALARLFQGDEEGALRFFGRSLAANPRDADVQANAGNLLLSLGRHDEALVRFDEALRLGTTRDLPVRLGRAAVLVRLGRADEGIAVAESVARSHGQVPEAWAVLAALAGEAGNEEIAGEAIDRFRQLKGRAPGPRDLPRWAGGAR